MLLFASALTLSGALPEAGASGPLVTATRNGELGVPARAAPTSATLLVAPGVTTQKLSIRVGGNHLVNGAGHAVRLLGVDRPGMDSLSPDGSCLTTQDFTSVAAIAAWHVNVVRVPLNEDCWLGINGPTASTAAEYRAGVARFVANLHSHRLYAILDLHMSAPGRIPATAMQAMPDADHAPAFWSSVASRFASDHAVLFDLFNEPHLTDVLAYGSDYWGCWLSGCSINVVNTAGGTSHVSWRAIGMQQLVNVVRKTGATQPIMLEGLNYANDLVYCAHPGDCASWLGHAPADKAKQLVASAHVYNYSYCNTPDCWSSQYLPVAGKYPVVTGELGENDCGHTFMDQYMRWADAHGISYVAWDWSPQTSCTPGQQGFGLITNLLGTPSSVGVSLRAHLAALAG